MHKHAPGEDRGPAKERGIIMILSALAITVDKKCFETIFGIICLLYRHDWSGGWWWFHVQSLIGLDGWYYWNTSRCDAPTTSVWTIIIATASTSATKPFSDSHWFECSLAKQLSSVSQRHSNVPVPLHSSDLIIIPNWTVFECSSSYSTHVMSVY